MNAKERAARDRFVRELRAQYAATPRRAYVRLEAL
jgi:hypothetical protein